ncbi:hypothetical protein [Microbulbifer sp. JMSA003]|uniref:hypothetical protein n=1 Tax=Microbulbifer sp. JMSA003 TaxID=3243369 RepID=UPI00403A24AE
MIKTVQFGKVIIHKKEQASGNEAILYAHGSFGNGSFGKAELPENLALYLYPFHGSASYDHAVRGLIKTGKPASEENGKEKFGTLEFLNMGGQERFTL